MELARMDPNDFGPNSPGSLVLSPHGVHAFCPSPLPENLPLDGETVRSLVEAEGAVGRLAGTTAREFNPYLVGSPMLHREAILSSRMEGTVTTPEQLVLLEAETASPGTKPRGDEDTEEVLNYVRAMQHGLGLLSELPVSLRLIREVHRVLLSGTRGGKQDPGEFRRSQNFIRGPQSERIEEARFIPPPVPQMKQALSEFEEYLHRDDLPDPFLIRLALIHYQFEAIHPFRDGNGRVGRLLMPLLMVSKGRLDSPILYLSAFFERHRQTYADLLLRVSQEGDWESWIQFFLRAVRESAGEATEQALALLDLRQSYHRRFQTGRSSARLIRLIDALFQNPSITIAKAAGLLDLSNQGAANNIHALEEAGVLREMTGRKRNQVYVADEILAFLYDSRDQED
jgi:Fic family protein